MSESQAPTAPTPAAGTSDLRSMAIVCYALYLALFVTGFTVLIGVVIAYIKRGESRGTIWQSHFDNLITVFWVTLIVYLIAIPIYLFVLGFSLLVGIAAWPVSILMLPFFLVVICFPFGLIVLAWYLYRTVKGILRAVDNRAYS